MPAIGPGGGSAVPERVNPQGRSSFWSPVLGEFIHFNLEERHQEGR
jgi:hypothetical protein